MRLQHAAGWGAQIVPQMADPQAMYAQQMALQAQQSMVQQGQVMGQPNQDKKLPVLSVWSDTIMCAISSPVAQYNTIFQTLLIKLGSQMSLIEPSLSGSHHYPDSILSHT